MNSEDDEFARIEREQKMRAVPDPIHHTDPGETLEYIQGWNDCRQAMLAEQPAQPYKGIGTPSSQPMPPEIKKMYEDYFDKCFRESSPAQQEPVYHPRQYGDVTGTKEVRTLQAQRTWVGLTIDEVLKIIDAEIGFNSCWGPEEAFAKAIEAKLKEKNT